MAGVRSVFEGGAGGGDDAGGGSDEDQGVGSSSGTPGVATPPVRHIHPWPATVISVNAQVVSARPCHPRCHVRSQRLRTCYSTTSCTVRSSISGKFPTSIHRTTGYSRLRSRPMAYILSPLTPPTPLEKRLTCDVRASKCEMAPIDSGEWHDAQGDGGSRNLSLVMFSLHILSLSKHCQLWMVDHLQFFVQCPDFASDLTDLEGQTRQDRADGAKDRALIPNTHAETCRTAACPVEYASTRVLAFTLNSTHQNTRSCASRTMLRVRWLKSMSSCIEASKSSRWWTALSRARRRRIGDTHRHTDWTST
jgi:hypothetical protein